MRCGLYITNNSLLRTCYNGSCMAFRLLGPHLVGCVYNLSCGNGPQQFLAEVCNDDF